jgi:DNA sulfur modification protein DndD
MIITQLSIKDFGVFHGLHEFDLRPRQIEELVYPVILIGGKNGAGKTTILEAIRLCLYGRSALGSRVRKTDYETYIKQRFHRVKNGDEPVQTIQIGIVFEHVHAGVKSIYDAARSWSLEGQSLQEEVLIYKDGQVLQDIAPEYWNDFLRDLIPPGVADLFFFDGEQIQALADDETETSALESAIGGLLNLDLVERLRADLNTYVGQQDGQKHTVLKKTLKATIKEYEKHEQTHLELKQDRASLRSQLGHVQKNLEEARQDLVTEGAQFIQHRTNLESRLKQVEHELQNTQNAIRELATGLLPFAVAPDWSYRLRERLEREEETQRTLILHDYQQSKADEIQDAMLNPSIQKRIAPELSGDQWHQLTVEISDLLQPDNHLKEVPIVHDVSPQQRYRLLELINEVLSDVPAQVQNLGSQLESLEKERSDLRDMLKQVPRDELALPLVEEFQTLSTRSGILHEQIDNIEQELDQVRFWLNEAERERSTAWRKLAEAGDVDQRMDYAAKTQVVLDQYLERITALKVQELEDMVADYFNLLCRKDTIVKEVKIDPKRYTVTLYGDNRVELPKSELSAGEKQLYAMALLWSLRSVSGRNLPIIVDTPMGRLDSDHRTRLLTEFFPQAAHQIILLSTDTEVDGQAFELLKPSISHVFRLEYDMALGRTELQEAYFDLRPEEMVS